MPLNWTDRRRPRNRKPPQFELPQAETVFNLAAEATTDGDRLSREAKAKAEAKRQQEQHQQQLL